MAKRRKKNKEEEEDYDFEFPEFDRIEYMKHEINKGKSVLVSIALAPLFSLASLEVFKLTGDWSIGFLTGIFGMLITLKIFEYLPLDISKFGKKEWAMNGAMYFLTWLGIWILLMNPPFGDFTDPVLNQVDFYVEIDGEWEAIDEANVTAQRDYKIMLEAKITDNDAVDEGSVTIEYEGDTIPMDPVGDHRFSVVFENVTADASTKMFTIRMEDVNGNSNSVVIEKTIRGSSE